MSEFDPKNGRMMVKHWETPDFPVSRCVQCTTPILCSKKDRCILSGSSDDAEVWLSVQQAQKYAMVSIQEDRALRKEKRYRIYAILLVIAALLLLGLICLG